MTKRVVVLDYGSGNLRSAQRALQRVGAEVEVTSDAQAADAADGLVVPGVGAFEACMTGLRKISGDKIIADRVIPAEMGKRLYAAANEPKRIEIIPDAGHNDMSDHGAWDKAREFLAGLR